MVPVILDGPRVDLNRLATGRKFTEEAAEAIEAWARARDLINCRSGEDLDEAARAEGWSSATRPTSCSRAPATRSWSCARPTG